jgi:hypothetical protein
VPPRAADTDVHKTARSNASVEINLQSRSAAAEAPAMLSKWQVVVHFDLQHLEMVARDQPF